MNRWYEFLKVDTGGESGILLNGRLNREIRNRKKIGCLTALYTYHRLNDVGSRLLAHGGDPGGACVLCPPCSSTKGRGLEMVLGVAGRPSLRRILLMPPNGGVNLSPRNAACQGTLVLAHHADHLGVGIS